MLLETYDGAIRPVESSGIFKLTSQKLHTILRLVSGELFLLFWPLMSYLPIEMSLQTTALK